MAARRWVVMGVSGCGKSAVGKLLAARLGAAYAEGDDDHRPENVAKMSAGIPLDDDDRRPWLQALQQRLRAARERGEGLVMTCSALKRRYRDVLRGGDPEVIFVHLDGSRELIAERVHARSGHFMPPALLDSQFQALEPLQPDENGVLLDIVLTPQQLVEQVMQRRP